MSEDNKPAKTEISYAQQFQYFNTLCRSAFEYSNGDFTEYEQKVKEIKANLRKDPAYKTLVGNNFAAPVQPKSSTMTDAQLEAIVDMG